jgi:hypothetical protein
MSNLKTFEVAPVYMVALGLAPAIKEKHSVKVYKTSNYYAWKRLVRARLGQGTIIEGSKDIACTVGCPTGYGEWLGDYGTVELDLI